MHPLIEKLGQEVFPLILEHYQKVEKDVEILRQSLMGAIITKEVEANPSLVAVPWWLAISPVAENTTQFWLAFEYEGLPPLDRSMLPLYKIEADKWKSLVEVSPENALIQCNTATKCEQKFIFLESEIAVFEKDTKEIVAWWRSQKRISIPSS